MIRINDPELCLNVCNCKLRLHPALCKQTSINASRCFLVLPFLHLAHIPSYSPSSDGLEYRRLPNFLKRNHSAWRREIIVFYYTQIQWCPGCSISISHINVQNKLRIFFWNVAKPIHGAISILDFWSRFLLQQKFVLFLD